MSLYMSLSQRSVCDCNKRILYCIAFFQIKYDDDDDVFVGCSTSAVSGRNVRNGSTASRASRRSSSSLHSASTISRSPKTKKWSVTRGVATGGISVYTPQISLR